MHICARMSLDMQTSVHDREARHVQQPVSVSAAGFRAFSIDTAIALGTASFRRMT